MKIILGKGRFAGPISGADETLVTYATQLQHDGQQVEVVLLYPHAATDPYFKRLKAAGVPVTVIARGSWLKMLLRTMRNRLPHVPTAPRRLLQKTAASLSTNYIEAAKKYFECCGADCVHIVTPDPASMTLIRAAHAAKIPVMYQELGTPDFLPELNFYYDELQQVLPLCGCVAALSPRLAQGFVQKRNWDRPLVLPLIVDAPAISVKRNSPETGIRFGFAGRLEYGKGPLLLVDAFARLCHEYKLDWTLSLVGTGPQHAEVQTRIRFHGMEKQCHIENLYHDSQGRSQWMQSIDVFVLPSLAEGTPNSIIEAMSHGVPTIASAVGGIPDVLNEQCGILLPPNDIGSLGHAMRKLGNDSGLRARMGAASCERYQSIFAPPAVLSILKATYTNLSLPEEAPCLFSEDHPWHPGSVV